MAKKAPKDSAAPALEDILTVMMGRTSVCIVGDTPLICNRLSEKARHELLMPAPKKNTTERATTLKHNPWDEFRASPYRLKEGPTEIAIMAASFKKSMMTAALDLPNTKKAQIGRLVWVRGMYTPVYGVPQILCAVVRSADMNRTPDIRTRAILPRWACQLDVSFVQPLITVNAVVRLLAAAGLFIGVGDWRQEKGSGSFGSFRLVEPDDEEFLSITKEGGRAAQLDALNTPTSFDEETDSLLEWFDDEIIRRKQKGVGATDKKPATPPPAAS